MQQHHLSRLMRMSWEIQRKKKVSHSKSLFATWAIFLNEDITVFYLTKNHRHDRYINKVQPLHLTLFNQ
ncbi:MAG TPA: hypothetical protein VHZ50_08805 [Puia sp.]|jgi:hypothetical protein|nr:hypothetical protein [Puia sp.]